MTSLPEKKRIQSIDLLRGIVMVIMALDHLRDFVHADSIAGKEPLNLETTTAAFFLTRWITHFCAPIFVFLAGTSIFLMSQKRTKPDLARFLFSRGLFLLILELTVVSLGWTFSISFDFLVFQVIGAIGVAMMAMAGLIFLPFEFAVGLGLILVFGHNLFDRFNGMADLPVWGMLISFLHVFHIFKFSPHLSLGIIYPVVPWLGIMLCGYGLGTFYKTSNPVENRRKQLLILGAICLVLLVALRLPNGYGDSKLWENQPSFLFTLLSFVNTSKYPPSLLYTVMTLGPALIFLAISEKWNNAITRFFLVFGQVPLFYYILHLYLIHGLSVFLVALTGMNQIPTANLSPFGLPENFGFGLPGTYLLWVLVIALLYFPCRWYRTYKSRHSHWWLSYL